MADPIPAPAPYCTAADVLRVLQGISLSASLTVSDSDPTFLALRWDATRYIERGTRRQFRLQDFTGDNKQRYDGFGTQQLILREYPIVDVTALRVYNWSFVLTKTYEASEYYVDKPRGIIVLTLVSNQQNLYEQTRGVLGGLTFPLGNRNVEVEYHAGYSTPPDDIVEAAAKALVIRALTGHTGFSTDGLQGFSLDGLSLQFGQGLFEKQIATWQRDVDQIVAYWKRPLVGRV